ncbi:MAG: hypothetical protein IIV61_07215 [Oscillospiraceae bacterium]|nr:hypothetical protein [Oscillospiraceae bacterium]
MKKSKLMRVIAIVLAVATFLPVFGNARSVEGVEPRANTHIENDYAEVRPMGGGKIRAYYWVDGVGSMTDIGAETVQIYESTDGTNWTWKKSFRYINMPELMGHGVDEYEYTLEYQGVAGRYYKAHVTLLARDADGQETRIYFTAQTRAT